MEISYITRIDTNSMPARHQKLLDQEFVCLDNGRFVFALLLDVQIARSLKAIPGVSKIMAILSICGTPDSNWTLARLWCPRERDRIGTCSLKHAQSRKMELSIPNRCFYSQCTVVANLINWINLSCREIKEKRKLPLC